ncbi:hypothetical protein HBB16_13305 [Pseudonocardia sp. MCCB 268]|nr:hypothetical protein [Pseudonocardia cytotoxica]
MASPRLPGWMPWQRWPTTEATVSGTYTVLDTNRGTGTSAFPAARSCEIRKVHFAPRIDIAARRRIRRRSRKCVARRPLLGRRPTADRAMLPEWIRRLPASLRDSRPTRPGADGSGVCVVRDGDRQRGGGRCPGAPSEPGSGRSTALHAHSAALSAGHPTKTSRRPSSRDAAAVHVGVDGMTAAEAACAVRRGIAYGRRSPRSWGQRAPCRGALIGQAAPFGAGGPPHTARLTSEAQPRWGKRR